MSAPSFDPTAAVRFDLPHGSVRAGWPEDRIVLVPSAALAEVLRVAPPAAAQAFVQALGAGVGRRAGARMLDPQASSVEEFATQLAGEAALAGLGTLSLERWGRALVLTFDDSPIAAPLLVPLVASAVEAAVARKVTCALLTHDERSARVLVTSQSAAARVTSWIASGMAWGAALAKLQGGSA